MFGFSFGEILIVAVVAIIFLGPDKLPQTLVDIAKFIKTFKKTINEAKEALDREVHISEIKQEALEYKRKIEEKVSDIKDDISNSADINEVTDILNSPIESIPESAPHNTKTSQKNLKKKDNNNKTGTGE